jgi:hypothetical protein
VDEISTTANSWLDIAASRILKRENQAGDLVTFDQLPTTSTADQNLWWKEAAASPAHC